MMASPSDPGILLPWRDQPYGAPADMEFLEATLQRYDATFRINHPADDRLGSG